MGRYEERTQNKKSAFGALVAMVSHFNLAVIQRDAYTI